MEMARWWGQKVSLGCRSTNISNRLNCIFKSPLYSHISLLRPQNCVMRMRRQKGSPGGIRTPPTIYRKILISTTQALH